MQSTDQQYYWFLLFVFFYPLPQRIFSGHQRLCLTGDTVLFFYQRNLSNWSVPMPLHTLSKRIKTHDLVCSESAVQRTEDKVWLGPAVLQERCRNVLSKIWFLKRDLLVSRFTEVTELSMELGQVTKPTFAKTLNFITWSCKKPFLELPLYHYSVTRTHI